MSLNSSFYLAFLLLSVLVYWGAPKYLRSIILIAFGLIFVAMSSIEHLIVLLALSIIAFIALKIKRVWVIGIVILVCVLAFFKYASVIGSLIASSTGTPLDWSAVALPLGISYLTFELIGTLVDRPNPNWKEFFAFAWFFPTRSAGPIKRYEQFAEQLKNSSIKTEYFAYGFILILIGLAQKNIIADPLAHTTGLLSTPTELRGSFDAAWLLFLYSIRIYADFAGITNIAMGSALLFGIQVPKNFCYPYLRENIALFWRNWHMSLSNWVRDYIYIPLGGSRVGQFRLLMNLMITMFIIGIWHGSTLNFAVWGIYHGAGLCIHRLWPIRMPRVLGILITFIFVTIGWAFFVTASLGDSILILQTLFGLKS
ncbi:MBOAT family protein [Patescibacteria group bacterium]|nr:MBOAT family protein [Patescibacteria group bacterium]MBU1123953.1 MBOAT family protein [Patescibacteria group bacterium]MBU1910838.1 MBOAT family protein [Patescibacteria group bacterium]